MSMLSALDATWICARSFQDRPAAPQPAGPGTVREPGAVAGDFSWRALARNPRALLVTGVMGAVVVKDAVAAVLAAR